nr:uncharacterized protein LOC109413991 [Aedes albopictus]
MDPPEATEEDRTEEAHTEQEQDKEETPKPELYANSLRVRFEPGSMDPPDAAIFSFMRDKMQLRSDDLLAMYKERSTMSVLIKFKTEEDVLKTLDRLPRTMDFWIEARWRSIVTLSLANSTVRYVRLFDLPPEIEDNEIVAALFQYGSIHRMVRETYGTDTGYPIWNSVRGVYMELMEDFEIPPFITIRNIVARVLDEGLINDCRKAASDTKKQEPELPPSTEAESSASV